MTDPRVVFFSSKSALITFKMTALSFVVEKAEIHIRLVHVVSRQCISHISVYGVSVVCIYIDNYLQLCMKVCVYIYGVGNHTV